MHESKLRNKERSSVQLFLLLLNNFMKCSRILPIKQYAFYLASRRSILLSGITLNDSLFHTDLIYYITLEDGLKQYKPRTTCCTCISLAVTVRYFQAKISHRSSQSATLKKKISEAIISNFKSLFSTQLIF